MTKVEEIRQSKNKIGIKKMTNKETIKGLIEKKYELWDFYEEPELLIASDDIAEIELFKRQYIKDTDGECTLHVKKRSDTNGN